MLPRHQPDRIRIAFDDHRLVANAGLILPSTLALRLGLPQLVDRRLDLGHATGRANTGDKMMTLVASALAGGDCINDADALRAGGTARVLGFTAKAPSTLGAFLRSFRWGHVRQLDRVSRELLARAWAAGAGPGDGPLTIDLDSTICETYGLAKDGARDHGYTGARGYHPLLAVAAGTGDVLMSRLREGRANTARGAAHFLRETVGRVRYGGAMGQLEDHWRKTPNFAEMVYHDMPEESTRLANFQPGKLDSFVMQLDSKTVVDKVPGIKYMRIVGGGNEQMGWFGNFYGGHGTPEHKEKFPGYDSDLPWVSSNPDINSEEWDRARKVRTAMSIAIDRQLIVDTILKGEGAPTILWGWEEAEHRLPPDMQKGWEYNPERAKQLLDEAGYPDGFEITLVPSIRGVPGEVDACFAAATMWEDIGIRTNQKRILYPTHRLTIIDRSFNQVNCHGGGGRVDPLTLHTTVNHSGGTWSGGMSHPVLDELIENALGIMDEDERWKASGEVARFLFENAGSAGLYKVYIIWPLGTRIDNWIDHLDWGDRRILGSTEYTPHRK